MKSTAETKFELKYFSEVTDDFRKLTVELDHELRQLNGELQLVYVQYNQIGSIKDIVITYFDGVPVGCASMKFYSDCAYELKRMFVSPDFRKRGIASQMVKNLMEVARDKGIKELILETGDVLLPAVAMYKKLGFSVVPNYGQYADMKHSICMGKTL